MTPKREKKESSDSIPNSESTDEKTKSKEAKKRKTESSNSDPVKKAKIKEHNFLDTITIVPDHKKKQKEEKERKKKAQQQLEKEKKIRQELEHQKKMETIKAERMRSNSDAGNNPPLGEKRDRRDSLIQSSTILAPEKKRPKTKQLVSQTKPPLSPVRSPKPIATQPTVIETPAPATTPKLFIPNVPPVTPKSEKPVTQEKQSHQQWWCNQRRKHRRHLFKQQDQLHSLKQNRLKNTIQFAPARDQDLWCLWFGTK